MKKHTTKTASQGHKEMHFLPAAFSKSTENKKEINNTKRGKNPMLSMKRKLLSVTNMTLSCQIL